MSNHCRSQLMASCCFQLLIYFLSAEFDSGINHCRQDFLLKIQGISIPVGKVIDISLHFSVCNHWHLSVHRMDFNFQDLSPSNPVGHLWILIFTGIRGNFIMLKFQFFATGIDMISNEVQTSQLYGAFYIFCSRFCHQVLWCFLLLRNCYVIQQLLCRTKFATQDDYTSNNFLHLSANIQFLKKKTTTLNFFY